MAKTLQKLFGVILIGCFISWRYRNICRDILRRMYLYATKINFKGVVPIAHLGSRWGFTPTKLANLNLENKVIVVTGANCGLGFETARLLVNQGAIVVLGCRSLTLGENAAQNINSNKTSDVGRAIFLHIDLSSFDSITNFSKELKHSFHYIDSLILNAGVIMAREGKTENGLELHIGVNHVGHFLLTKLVIDLLQKVPESYNTDNPSTIVVLSSLQHYMADPDSMLMSLKRNEVEEYDGEIMYANSKLANILFARKLSNMLSYKTSLVEEHKSGKRKVLVNSVHPGVVLTGADRHIISRLSKLTSLKESYLANLYRFLFSPFLWGAETAALTSIYAAVSNEVLKNKITGKYFHPIARETLPSEEARSEELQNLVWDLSEDLVHTHIYNK